MKSYLRRSATEKSETLTKESSHKLTLNKDVNLLTEISGAPQILFTDPIILQDDITETIKITDLES